MTDNCLENAFEKRRSIYNLGSRKVLPENEIVDIVSAAVKHTPSAFNSQSARVVVLFGEHYRKLWNIVLDELRKIVPADKFAATEAKVRSFMDGYGTVLFFEDADVVQKLQADFPLYKDNFPKWSEQANGMLQFAIWTALAKAGVGASLQHYNPLIDAAVASAWNLPSSWKLVAEMPFGSIEAPAGEKSFMPIEERVKVFK